MILASSAVNCQFTFDLCLLRYSCQAVVSPPDIFYVINPSVQALPREHIQFYLCHIQPTPMLRSKHKIKSIPKLFCLGWPEGFVKRPRSMSIKIVHHYCYFFSIAVKCGYVLKKICPVGMYASLENVLPQMKQSAC